MTEQADAIVRLDSTARWDGSIISNASDPHHSPGRRSLGAAIDNRDVARLCLECSRRSLDWQQRGISSDARKVTVKPKSRDDLAPAAVTPEVVGHGDETFTTTLNRYLSRSGLSLTALARRSWLDISYVSRLVHLPCDPLLGACPTLGVGPHLRIAGARLPRT